MLSNLHKVLREPRVYSPAQYLQGALKLINTKLSNPYLWFDWRARRSIQSWTKGRFPTFEWGNHPSCSLSLGRCTCHVNCVTVAPGVEVLQFALEALEVVVGGVGLLTDHLAGPRGQLCARLLLRVCWLAVGAKIRQHGRWFEKSGFQYMRCLTNGPMFHLKIREKSRFRVKRRKIFLQSYADQSPATVWDKIGFYGSKNKGKSPWNANGCSARTSTTLGAGTRSRI